MRAERWVVPLLLCVACEVSDDTLSALYEQDAGETDAGEPALVVVAPNGSGTACTTAAPCGLDSARRRVVELSSDRARDVNVELRGGVYRLREPLRFGSTDSGRAGHVVTWRAEAGQTPVLSGAVSVDGWSLSDPATGLWRAMVPAALRSRQLYIDGARVPVAQGAPPVALSGSEQGYTAADASYAGWRNPDKLEFVYPGGAGMWTEPRCRVGEIDGTFIRMSEPCWTNTTRRHHVMPPALDPYNMPPSTLPTRIENAFELLEPGQFYLDLAEHALYYRSAGDIDPSRALVEVPVLEQLLVAEGTLDEPVHDLAFSGLTFAYATWNGPSTGVGFSEVQTTLTITAPLGALPQGTCDLGVPPGSCPFGAYTSPPAAVSFRAADHVSVTRAHFEHLGATGLLFAYGSHDNRIEGNVFADISGIGVQLGESNDPHPEDVMADARETCARNVIANNLIHHVGQEYHGAVGIMVFVAQHTTIKNNELHDLSYTGISSGALSGHADVPSHPDTTTNVNSDNEISNNVIYRYLMSLGDGGAIYLEGHQNETVRRPDQSIDEEAGYAHGLKVIGNVAYHQGLTGNAFYDDIGSQWITFNQNVQWQGWSAHGGCLPVGHIRFVDNHHSDSIGDFGCGQPIDTTLEHNHALPRQPGPGDLPLDVLRSAGLEAAFRDLGRQAPPLLEYASPAEGTAATRMKVLLAGSGFSPSMGVRRGDKEAVALEVLSANFAIATAPEGAKLGSAQLITDAGTARLPLNDTDPAIVYQGDWKPDWVPGSYEDYSLHTAQLDGASFSVEFEGTGVEYVTDMDRSRATADVFVDGNFMQSVTCTAPGWTHQQVCARVSGLPHGRHSLKVVKTRGSLLTLDALRILP